MKISVDDAVTRSLDLADQMFARLRRRAETMAILNDLDPDDIDALMAESDRAWELERPAIEAAIRTELAESGRA